MPSNQSKRTDYETLSSTAQKSGAVDKGLKTLKPKADSQKPQPIQTPQNLANPSKNQSIQTVSPQNDFLEKKKSDAAEPFAFKDQTMRKNRLSRQLRQ